MPRRSALELQRDSDALLLLLPEAGGRGRTVPSGKIFEYLAAERPILAAVPTDGVAAELVRRADAGRRRRPGRRRGAAVGDRRATRALGGGRARRRKPLAGAAGAALAPYPFARVRRAARGASAEQPGTLQETVASSRGRLVAFLFLATMFSVSFQSVFWDVAGRVNLADVLAVLFLVAFVASRIWSATRLVPPTTLAVLGFAPRSARRLPVRLLQSRDEPGALAVREGADEVPDPLRLPRGGRRLPRAAFRALLLADARVVRRRLRGECGVRSAAARRHTRRPEPRRARPQPDHRRRGVDQHLGSGRRVERLPRERSDRRREPSRRDAHRPAAAR